MDEPITIQTTRDVEHQDGSPRWRRGAVIHTTQKELSRRGVPADAYRVIHGDASPGSAPDGKDKGKQTA